MAGDPDGHCWDARPALLAQAPRGPHPVVEVDAQPDPRAVSMRTRGTAAGAPAPRGAQTPPGARPTRHERRLAGGPQPTTGPLLPDPSGAVIPHARDEAQALARALAHLHHRAAAQVARRAHAGRRGAPAAPAAAPAVDLSPDRQARGRRGLSALTQPHRRATTGAIRRAARACGRGPQDPHRPKRRRIASAVCRHSTGGPRRLACLSSSWTAALRRARVTWA